MVGPPRQGDFRRGALRTHKNRLKREGLSPMLEYFNRNGREATIHGRRCRWLKRRVSDKLQPMADLDEKMKSMLAAAKTIAVVGASPNSNRPSHGVMSYLIGCGYDVFPVRPKVAEVLGRKCYASLQEIPVPVDIVDVFRKPEACPDVARAAVAIGAKLLWLQEGIISDEAAGIASAGGLRVIMDRCIMKVFRDNDY